jgi:pimeloyl-ACP methyl ester carboxylesterase
MHTPAAEMLRPCSIVAAMHVPHDRRFWAAAAGVGLLGAGAALELRHTRRIAHDPAQADLEDPPRGRAISVRSPDGTRLHAEAFGPEDADTTVVLAHGWTENRTFWIHQIRALSAEGIRVVAYDHRGHGESESAAGDDYSIERFGEDLEAVLESCAPDAAHTVLAGHSLGAMAIVGWAEHHEVRKRVGAAGLFNTGVGDLLTESLLMPVPPIAQALNRTIAMKGFLGSRAPLPRFSSPISHALIRYTAFGPTASPAQVAYYERMLIASPPDARAKIGIALSELELYDALPRLDVPTIVMAGENDRLTPPSHARRIAERLPELVELIILPDTGHMEPLERPREVNDALLNLARRLQTTETPALTAPSS